MTITVEKKPTPGSEYLTIAALATELSKEEITSVRFGQAVKVAVEDGTTEDGLKAMAVKLRSGLAKHGRFTVENVAGALWVSVNTAEPRKGKKPASRSGGPRVTRANRKGEIISADPVAA